MSSIVAFPVSLPTVPLAEETNAAEVAGSFGAELQSLDAHHFLKDAVWRDIFALTGTLRTFYGPSSISAAWKETCSRAKAGSFKVNAPSAHVIRTPTGKSWVQAMFQFETDAVPPTTCSGLVALVLDSDGKWRVWVLRTILEQLKSQGNVDFLDLNGEAAKSENGQAEQSHFDCVVIGGGQAGLSTGGRLKALGVSYVVLDKNKEVGDNWKTRYDSARLHTSREYGHLPFDRTFGPDYQEWLTKDDLAKGYQEWVSKFGINIWMGSTVISGTWNSDQSLCTLTLKRDNGSDQSITCSYVVIAGGGGGQLPQMPDYPNQENFQGIAIHSAHYINSSKWKGKKGVVVGTANTGHDVAEDMVKAGLSSVTMVQRSKTYILPREYYKRIVDLSYNANIPTVVSDKITLTQPFAILDLLSKSTLDFMASKQPERFDALEKVGFKTERYGNLTDALYNRMGGHYLDVGVSEMISKGLIKVKSNSVPTHYTPTGLAFADGTQLDVDVIVFATGFDNNMSYLARDLFGPEVAGLMGDYWGLNKEGELRGAFVPTGHPSMWYMGGTIGMARYFSRFIALQIKAKTLGTPLAIYADTP